MGGRILQKEKIGLIGGGFQHAYSSTLWKNPTYFDWIKNEILKTTFFIDEAIVGGINKSCENKFGWVVESKMIIPQVLNEIKKYYKEISEAYKIIFTHHKEIYELADNFIYLPPHGYWVKQPKIYDKTKLVSMISSNKLIGEGHKFRLKWVEKLRPSLDLFGFGFKSVTDKEDALRDYMFSVTIENDQYETYWTEKLLDCFATGTIPVYHGTPDIYKYFNMDGIIILTDSFSVSQLNEAEYYKRMPAIIDNFNRSLKYNIIEDIMYERWLKNVSI